MIFVSKHVSLYIWNFLCCPEWAEILGNSVLILQALVLQVQITMMDFSYRLRSSIYYYLVSVIYEIFYIYIP